MAACMLACTPLHHMPCMRPAALVLMLPLHTQPSGTAPQLHTADALKWMLSREIADLKREAARYNTPSMFAKCAKCQRQIAAKEKQLSALDADKSPSWQDGVLKALNAIKVSRSNLGRYSSPLSMAAIAHSTPLPPPYTYARLSQLGLAAVFVFSYYGQPLLYIAPEASKPLHRMLAVPHGQTFSEFGAVAVIPWLFICNKATNFLVQAALPVASQRAATSKPRKGAEPVESKKEL